MRIDVLASTVYVRVYAFAYVCVFTWNLYNHSYVLLKSREENRHTNKCLELTLFVGLIEAPKRGDGRVSNREAGPRR